MYILFHVAVIIVTYMY